MNEFLNMVRVYLTQELPPPYNNLLSIVDERIRVTLPENLKFNEAYALLQPLIEASVQRIRNREIDLPFTIWTPSQSRDFKVYIK